MSRLLIKSGAVVGALSLAALAAGPAVGATHVAQASASALTISVAGNGNGTGTFVAYNDGHGQKTTGSSQPPLSVLKNNPVINTGVLAQEATANVVSSLGQSKACAGLAGQGGSVAQVGSTDCLKPGDPITLALGKLDLSKTILIDPSSALGQLSALNALGPAVLGPVTSNISNALKGTPLATTGLDLGLSAISSSCTSVYGAAAGDATLVGGNKGSGASTIDADLGGQKVNLLTFPVNPPPNFVATLNTQKLADMIIAGLKTDLATSFDAGLSPANKALVDPLQTQIVDAVTSQIDKNLAPQLDKNLLHVVLNEQSHPTSDSVKVTALDASVLPAAKQFAGAPLAGVQIGTVTCGPNGKVEAAAPPATHNNTAAPAIPRHVDSGLAGTPVQHSGQPGDHSTLIAALAVLLALAAGTGTLAYRRFTLPKV